MRRTPRILFVVAVVAIAGVLLAMAASFSPVRGTVEYLWGRARGGYSVAERLEQFGLSVEDRLKPVFAAAGVRFPPTDLALVAFKDAKTLELYARDADQPWRFVKAYPVLAASGGPGPKLMEGDRQVPEGVYHLESLNPNSRFHVSLRLDYPNAWDRQMAQADGRADLGGDIMIHGSSASIGCLAMGDEAAEELFVLSALTGRDRVKIVISPTDLRAHAPMAPGGAPQWVGQLYEALRQELQQFRKETTEASNT